MLEFRIHADKWRYNSVLKTAINKSMAELLVGIVGTNILLNTVLAVNIT